jgi:quinol monooxygenase YgiN
MPTLPWTEINAPAPGSATEPFVMASRLELRSRRHGLLCLWRSLAAWRQVRRAPGGFGASLIADLRRGVFWTLSAWEGKDALDAYARTDPHKTIVKGLRPLMRGSHFVFWTVPADGLPIAWDDAKRRIAAAREQEARE